jgi:succinoglycan biosynthesis protein ExoW
MTKCSVVIPYYQREPGILRRALASVFAQTHANFDVIVVDDESPYPIEMELDGINPGQLDRLIIVKQPNGGPGAARNAGLDRVPADSDYVAFLDSDDEWTPDHLKIALSALSLFDAQCYFAAIGGGDAFHYHFDMTALSQRTELSRLSDDPPIFEAVDLPGVMLENWSFMHLSCMVIAAPLFRTIRFEASLRLAAEDVLFFYECVRKASRSILSDTPGAVRGEGLNIFHGVDNTSPQFLKQQFNTWAALDRLERQFDHAPKNLASIEGYKQTARRQALWGQAKLIKHRRPPQLGELARWAWRDPKLMASALGLALSKFRKQAERP